MVNRFSACERTQFEINDIVRIVDDEYNAVKPCDFENYDQESMLGHTTNQLRHSNLNIIIIELLTATTSGKETGALVEFAGVKIENGKITQTISTFIDPIVQLSEENKRCAGISTADIYGKP